MRATFESYKFVISAPNFSIIANFYLKKYFPFKQIGANNCVARYRSLSGGVGSPTPTHSSDYVDDDDEDEDDNDDTTDKTAVLNGTSSSPECSNAMTSGNVTKHTKVKQNNNHASHSSKASNINFQKASASVHYVSASIDCKKEKSSILLFFMSGIFLSKSFI